MPATLTVKNVPDDLLERLRKRAREHHRSLQGELMYILEQATGPRPLSLEEADAWLKARRVQTGGDSVRMIRELRDGR